MAWKISKAKRRALVKLQLRDKKGRWIEMGGGVKWYSKRLGREITGTVKDIVGNNAVVAVRDGKGTETGQSVRIPGRSLTVINNKATLAPKSNTAARQNKAQTQAKAETEARNEGGLRKVNGEVVRDEPASSTPSSGSDRAEDYTAAETSDGQVYVGRADGSEPYTPAADLKVGDKVMPVEGADERKPYSIGENWNRRSVEAIDTSKGGAGTVSAVNDDHVVVTSPDGQDITVGKDASVIKSTKGLEDKLRSVGSKLAPSENEDDDRDLSELDPDDSEFEDVDLEDDEEDSVPAEDAPAGASDMQEIEETVELLEEALDTINSGIPLSEIKELTKEETYGLVSEDGEEFSVDLRNDPDEGWQYRVKSRRPGGRQVAAIKAEDSDRTDVAEQINHAINSSSDSAPISDEMSEEEQDREAARTEDAARYGDLEKELARENGRGSGDQTVAYSLPVRGATKEELEFHESNAVDDDRETGWRTTKSGIDVYDPEEALSDITSGILSLHTDRAQDRDNMQADEKRRNSALVKGLKSLVDKMREKNAEIGRSNPDNVFEKADNDTVGYLKEASRIYGINDAVDIDDENNVRVLDSDKASDLFARAEGLTNNVSNREGERSVRDSDGLDKLESLRDKLGVEDSQTRIQRERDEAFARAKAEREAEAERRANAPKYSASRAAVEALERQLDIENSLPSTQRWDYGFEVKDGKISVYNPENATRGIEILRNREDDSNRRGGGQNPEAIMGINDLLERMRNGESDQDNEPEPENDDSSSSDTSGTSDTSSTSEDTSEVPEISDETLEPSQESPTPVPQSEEELLAESERKLNVLGIQRTEPRLLEGESYPPTRQQQDVIDAVMAGKSTLVQAKAGAGKTSTLEAIARRVKENDNSQILYIAFNKSVQTEAEGRMPTNVESRTGHSLAFRWAPSWIKDRSGMGRGDKAKKTAATQLVGGEDISSHLNLRPEKYKESELDRGDLGRLVMEAVGAFQYSADDELGSQHLPDDLKETPEMEADMLDAARRAWKDVSSEGGVIKPSLDTMRKLWALSRPDLTKNAHGSKAAKVLFLDEAQDTPPVLAKVVEDQNMQKVIVGDADQAIYGFTGATDYLSKATGDIDLPLNKSWRFGPEVADAGNRFLQLAGSPERVIGGGPGSKIVSDMKDADAVLTRSNAGLISEILTELERERTVGVPKNTKKELVNMLNHASALMSGRQPFVVFDDFAPYKNWKELSDAVKGGKASTRTKMYHDIISNTGMETLRNMLDKVIDPADYEQPKGWKAKQSALKDDPLEGVGFDGKNLTGNTFNLNSTLKNFTEGGIGKAGFRWDGKNKSWVARDANSWDNLQKAIKDLTESPEYQASLDKSNAGESFGPEMPEVDVTISTAHKAKGLEWGRVRIGDDFRGPEKEDDADEDAEEKMPSEEELRLYYVAVTRAEKELDLGSLAWVMEYTDENGGTPEGSRSNDRAESNDSGSTADESSTIDESEEDSEGAYPTPEVESDEEGSSDPDPLPEPAPDVDPDPEVEEADAPAAPETIPDPEPEPVETSDSESSDEEALDEDGLTPAEGQRRDDLNEQIGAIFRGDAEGDVDPLYDELDEILARGESRKGSQPAPAATEAAEGPEETPTPAPVEDDLPEVVSPNGLDEEGLTPSEAVWARQLEKAISDAYRTGMGDVHALEDRYDDLKSRGEARLRGEDPDNPPVPEPAQEPTPEPTPEPEAVPAPEPASEFLNGFDPASSSHFTEAQGDADYTVTNATVEEIAAIPVGSDMEDISEDGNGSIYTKIGPNRWVELVSGGGRLGHVARETDDLGITGGKDELLLPSNPATEDITDAEFAELNRQADSLRTVTPEPEEEAPVPEVAPEPEPEPVVETPPAPAPAPRPRPVAPVAPQPTPLTLDERIAAVELELGRAYRNGGPQGLIDSLNRQLDRLYAEQDGTAAPTPTPPAPSVPRAKKPAATQRKPRSKYEGAGIVGADGQSINSGDIITHPKFGPVEVTGIVPSAGRVQFTNPNTGKTSTVDAAKVSQAPAGSTPAAPGVSPDLPEGADVNVSSDLAPGTITTDPVTGKKAFVNSNGTITTIGDRVVDDKTGRSGRVKAVYKGADGSASVQVDWDNGESKRSRGRVLRKESEPMSVAEAPKDAFIPTGPGESSGLRKKDDDRWEMVNEGEETGKQVTDTFADSLAKNNGVGVETHSSGAFDNLDADISEYAGVNNTFRDIDVNKFASDGNTKGGAEFLEDFYYKATGPTTGSVETYTNRVGDNFTVGTQVWGMQNGQVKRLGIAVDVEDGMADVMGAGSGGHATFTTVSLDRAWNKHPDGLGDWDTSKDLTFDPVTERSADMSEKLSQAYPGVQFSFNDDNGSDFNADFASTVSKLFNKYPMLQNAVVQVGTADLGGLGENFGQMTSLQMDSSPYSGIIINLNRFDPTMGGAGSYTPITKARVSEAHQEGVRSINWSNHADEGREVEYTVTHEFGHALDRMVGGLTDQDILDILSAILGYRVTENSPELRKLLLEMKAISNYSTIPNKGVYTVELVAESFADVELNGANAKAVSKAVHKLLMQRLKERAGQ